MNLELVFPENICLSWFTGLQKFTALLLQYRAFIFYSKELKSQAKDLHHRRPFYSSEIFCPSSWLIRLFCNITVRWNQIRQTVLCSAVTAVAETKKWRNVASLLFSGSNQNKSLVRLSLRRCQWRWSKSTSTVVQEEFKYNCYKVFLTMSNDFAKGETCDLLLRLITSGNDNLDISDTTVIF